MVLLAPQVLFGAPYADMVIDARTGEVLHETNSDARLHPASLTKMMTLYIAFEAIKNGEISLDSEITISAHAASEPPSRLGLAAGQKIKLRYLIRAAAIKSANDAATAIGEAISGSEAAFARRMNKTAKALGMKNTTFKNANGLTEEGHLSTAHDMTILARHVFYDHPEYYNIFSRRTADAGGKVVTNTNSRFLDSYKGADGIKTGFTQPAGFNLVASAERDDVRIIATVFGGLSTAQRNAKVSELMDLGFELAPSDVRTRKPKKPAYADVEDESLLVADASSYFDEDAMAEGIAESVAAQGVAAGKTIRLNVAPKTSPFPQPRPDFAAIALAEALAGPKETEVAEASEIAADPVLDDATMATLQTGVMDALQSAVESEDEVAELAELASYMPKPRPAFASDAAPEPEVAAVVAEVKPVPPPAEAAPVEVAAAEPEPVAPPVEASATDTAVATAAHPPSVPVKPVIEAETFEVAAAEPAVVSRLSTSGGRHWAVNVGSFNSSYEAEKALLRTALQEIGTLDEAQRKVIKGKGGYDANFVGLTEDMATLACRRLSARAVPCTPIGPSG